MITHEIIGDDMQAVVVSMAAGDEIRAEAGAMTYMTDGIEMDAEDGLVVCHLGIGIWRFDSNCLPTHLAHAGKAAGTKHRLMTNIAFKGKTLYITAGRSLYKIRTNAIGYLPYPR